MIETSSYSVKEIKQLLHEIEITPDILEAFRNDPRGGVRNAVRAYEREQKERERVDALYEYEREAAGEGCEIVAGVDEAGRGPLAGPVAVAAVILPTGLFIPKLNDSKKLSPKSRDELYDVITEKAVAYKCVLVDAATIDRVNILQATINGMYEAILNLNPQPDKVLIDAVNLDRLPMPSLSIIGGDAKSASIGAASIIAKVTRDRLMMEYDATYPEYGFARHKGYGTREHIEAIRKYGPCPIHRKSFEPISSMI
ncbi:MAG: ribonuclease HII [Schwartzia sp.]|nr:ribonuclease HII [Schwartzia sp. (in: firmicutes)]